MRRRHDRRSTARDALVAAWRLAPAGLLALLLGLSAVVGLAQIATWIFKLVSGEPTCN